MHVILFLLYVALCGLVGWLGRDSRLGGWGTFIVSLIVTPFVTFVIVFLLSSGRFGPQPPR
jgi:hypothetical protein